MTEKTTYQSPFSWRYGSQEMREIWSLRQTRLLWRQLWVVLAEVQQDYGLVSSEQVKELRKKQDQLDLDHSREIEDQIQHDLMAELQVYVEQCPNAGGVIHLGATSMDIKDNALVLQIKPALDLVEAKLRNVLEILSKQIDSWSDLTVMGFTHLQSAEPTTLGYRMAQPAQDLLFYLQEIQTLQGNIKGKGFTGAVGTSASFSALIGDENIAEFQKKLSEKIGISFFTASTQTYPRIQDYQVLSSLAGIGAIISKLAFDIRILQSPGMGELAEPFGLKQVGSSAMPFKQNPIKSEKLNSLARYLAQLPRIAWDNAAGSLLERTMDDSANRRSILPEGFLAIDEMLSVSSKILSGLQLFESRISSNLEDYGPFAATEHLLMLLCKAGGDRQEMYKTIRDHSLKAWSEVQKGNPNPLMEFLSGDPILLEYLPGEKIIESLQTKTYAGDAAHKARVISTDIIKKLSGK